MAADILKVKDRNHIALMARSSELGAICKETGNIAVVTAERIVAIVVRLASTSRSLS